MCGREGINDVEDCLELLSVRTLRQHLDQHGPLTLAEASVVLDQVAVALDTLHLQGRIHGFVVPTNVLVLPGGSAHLLCSHTTAASSVSCPPRSFAAGASYLSPEEARGDTVTAATDIWCLGALLYEMLTARAPFVALRLTALREQVISDEPDLLPEAASEAQLVIDYALAKWPMNRFLTAQALANKLWATAPVATSSSVTTVKKGTDLPVVPASAVSLSQAVNRPLTFAGMPVPTAMTPGRIAPRGNRLVRFFGGRYRAAQQATV